LQQRAERFCISADCRPKKANMAGRCRYNLSDWAGRRPRSFFEGRPHTGKYSKELLADNYDNPTLPHREH